MRDYHVYVLCSTARFNTTSYDWVPKKAIYSDVTDIEKVVGELLASQKEKLEKLAKSGKLKPAGVSGQGGAKKKGKGPAQGKRSNPNHAHEKEKRQKLTEAAQYALANSKDATGGDGDDEDDVPDILVIMDDVCSEESIRHSRAMGTVSMNGRQYRMSVLILSQMVARDRFRRGCGRRCDVLLALRALRPCVAVRLVEAAVVEALDDVHDAGLGRLFRRCATRRLRLVDHPLQRVDGSAPVNGALRQCVNVDVDLIDVVHKLAACHFLLGHIAL